MIAKVIVDVPSRQTDRPFDYEIPIAFQPFVKIGSRIAVEFGPRTLQGFVIGFTEETDYDRNKLKPIKELLDPVPPLLPDLMELSAWISEKYCCSRISALQVMLPSALKGKEEKFISVTEQALEDEELAFQYEPLFTVVKQQGYLSWDKIVSSYPDLIKLLKSGLDVGVFEAHSVVKDKVNVKKQLAVSLSETFVADSSYQQQLEILQKRAKKQYEILAYLLKIKTPILMSELVSHLKTGSSTVHQLEEKGFVTITEQEMIRDPYRHRTFIPSQSLPLTDEQQMAYERIVKQMHDETGQTMLLHGVTGSGKTEVYLQTIEQCLLAGKQAIVLVPEISLTPQMVERFKSRFGQQVAVMHSRLSHGEKYDEWRKIRYGKAKVVVGARSAIFAPFKRIGLIIIDEEHESSYKQEESPKYHAREVAVFRAKQHGAAVVLGSATPSLETYAAANRNPEAALIALPNRVNGQAMPEVKIIDMREQLQSGNRSMFSKPLYEAIGLRLAKKEQTVLLLNRRGYSTFVMCRSCGYVATCPHCDIALTFHQKTNMLRCHYCGHAEHSPKTCPTCTSEHIRFFGTGTQKVEEELAKLFPGIRVIRMDVDTTTEKHSHEKLLKAFGEHKADVLLGTQMVAKGLDFPLVTLVGVIAADSTLNLPDFRSAERTFQLITQVAGRAGRHELPGEVIVQTYTPEHYAIEAAQQHSFEQFMSQELKLRSVMGYPPFCRIIAITMQHESLPQLMETSSKFVKTLKELAEYEGLLVPLNSQMQRALEILGPVASPISKIKDRYRYQCVLKYRGRIDAGSLVNRAVEPFLEVSAQKKVQFIIDVDPQTIM